MAAGLRSICDLEVVKGGEADVAALVGKRPFVLEAWATWCPPCRDSIPHLTELAHKYPSVAFLGVTNEQRGPVDKFVAGMGGRMDYNVLLDTNDSAMNFLSSQGMRGIPFAVLVDAGGRVVYSGHPMEPEFESKLAVVAAAAAAAAATEPLPNVRSMSEAEIGELKVKTLKALLSKAHVDITGVAEKSELVALVVRHLCA